MRFLALVTDYDGTLTQNDRLADTTAAALGRLRASGRRAILVTGRRLDDLFQVLPRTKLFDDVVAENGALLYDRASGEAALPMRVIPGRAERLRQHRKCAIGDVGYNSFYFRDPHGRLNLKAQNLAIFRQVGEGVDDETWLFHLQRGDYSHWLREVIKDPRLADLVQGIERQPGLLPAHSRRLVRDAIAARYTLPE